VTDIAIVPDYSSVFAHMVAIMAAETAREVKVADVVRVGFPVRLHFREEVCLVKSKDFIDRGIDRSAPFRI